MNKYKGIIFDLDGTLLDTLSDLSDSVNEVLNGYNFPTYSKKEYKEKIGHGFRNLIEQCLPKQATKALIDESLQLFLESYDKKYKNKTKPYTGINNLLIGLDNLGIKMAVNSNKRDDYSNNLIKTHFPHIVWVDIIGERKEFIKKPDPSAALFIADKMNLKPSEILYVGDSKTDMITAQNARMDSVGVLWGFRNEKELKENKATYIVKKPNEILNLVEKKKGEKELEVHANNIRKNIIMMINNAKSGHPGGSLSGVEIVTHLYFKEMDIDDENINTFKRDRFVLSKGHASPLLYSVLAEKNFIKKETLNSFRQINTTLQGHPNMNYLDSVDMSTGSLGQGISCAVGMALANKIDMNKHRVYALLGDGECEEGQVWEAAMAAAHYKLDNLCAIVDYNGLQIDGNIKEVMNPTPIDKKFEAFNWKVICINGHDFEEIKSALIIARKTKGQPTMILANTIKGKGISFMENNYAWHGSAPNYDQCEEALKELEDANNG